MVRSRPPLDDQVDDQAGGSAQTSADARGLGPRVPGFGGPPWTAADGPARVSSSVLGLRLNVAVRKVVRVRPALAGALLAAAVLKAAATVWSRQLS